jgi:cytosine/adenosine deaminase-related metal-dependent hydrolase
MGTVAYLNLREEIESRIKKNGGWVNCHGHFDRAYSISPKLYKLANAYRHEKWKLNTELRKNSTVEQIYDRMAQAIETLLAQGVTATGTFIDIDPVIKDKAIKAAQKLTDTYSSQITIKYLNQSSYGLFEKEAREWFDVAADFVDILGGLLKHDQGREQEHLDILLGTAKAKKKMVHVHIDELNIPEERETEMLAHKMIEHGMQGRVAGIHGISINARPKKEREKIYKLMKKAELMMIACPMSWINARRSEELSPIHNPTTPLDEMHAHGIIVGLGLDNIADLFMPFNDANMWNDLRLLFETNRFYEIDEVVKIATVNGRKILGIK